MTRASITTTFLATVRAHGRAMIVPTFLAGFCTATSFCLLPIPYALWGLCRANAAACGVDVARLPFLRSFPSGVLGLLAFLPWLGSMCIGAKFSMASPDHPLPALVLQASVAVVGTAAMAPWLGAATIIAVSGSSTRESLARSMVLFVRGNALRTVGAAATIGVWLSIPVWCVRLSQSFVGLGVGVVGSLVAWIATIAMGRAISCTAPRSGRSTSALALLPLVAAAATSGLLVSVAPLAWEQPRPEHVSGRRLDEGEPATIGGLRLVAHAGELEVQGSAGTWTLRAHDDETVWQEYVPYWYAEPDATGDVFVTRIVGYHEHSLGSARLAPDGTWRADTAGTRISQRATTLVIVSLLVSLLSAAWCVVRARERRALAVGPARAIAMRLRLDEGASLAIEGDRLVPTGGVHLETPDGSAVIRLSGVVASTSMKDTWRDGDALHVIVPGHVDPLGFRTGAAAWPAGAWIADEGDAPEDARLLDLMRAIALPALASALSLLFAGSMALLRL